MSDWLFFFASRRRHTKYIGDWSSDGCSSDLETIPTGRMIMKKLLMASAASALVAGAAQAGGHIEIKLGILLGFTGPIESLAAPMGQEIGRAAWRGRG